MNKYVFLSFLVLPPLLFAQPQQEAQQKPPVITHVAVIDATGAATQPDMTVVISGDRIAALGKTDKVKAPDNAEVVDASGKFLIPGLWDMHVHWYDKSYLPIICPCSQPTASLAYGRCSALRFTSRGARNWPTGRFWGRAWSWPAESSMARNRSGPIPSP